MIKLKESEKHCATQKAQYFDYMPYAICEKNRIFYSFNLSTANFHDINYLIDISELPVMVYNRTVIKNIHKFHFNNYFFSDNN